MSNKIVDAAVSAINEQNLKLAVERASVIIGEIAALNRSISEDGREVGELQAELARLQQPDITPEGILGTPLPSEASQNENQKTIARAISTMVKAKLGGVEAKCSRLGEEVIAKQFNMASSQAAIAKLQARLGEIVPEVVTTTEITG